ncbi:MAG: hypothetical protein AB7H80_10405, partial [Candidatus Kapaibacterium sp.]
MEIKKTFSTMDRKRLTAIAVSFVLICLGVPNLHAQDSTAVMPGAIPGDFLLPVSSPITGTGFPALETYSPVTRSFASTLSDERGVMSVVTQAWLEFFMPNDYLRILPVKNRVSYIDAPAKAKPMPKGVGRVAQISGAGIPSVENAWISSQPIDVLISDYSRRYNLDFAVHRSAISGEREGDTLVVAYAVRRINDVVVTVTLWNPTLSSKGKSVKSIPPSTTSIVVEERAFLHRSLFIA